MGRLPLWPKALRGSSFQLRAGCPLGRPARATLPSARSPVPCHRAKVPATLYSASPGVTVYTHTSGLLRQVVKHFQEAECGSSTPPSHPRRPGSVNVSPRAGHTDRSAVNSTQYAATAKAPSSSRTSPCTESANADSASDPAVGGVDSQILNRKRNPPGFQS